MADQPLYIGVAGIMGSGKTTIAKSIAASLDLLYLPAPNPSNNLLSDLFVNPSRWAFDAQIGFFINKAIQLMNALRTSIPVIIDRTLYEDVEIFCRYFFEKGHIDERSYTTYSKLVEYFLHELPPPTLTIYCRCSLNSAEARIKERSREFQKLYPDNHLNEILNSYDSWLEKYDKSSIVILDTDKYDSRHSNTIRKIIEEIKTVITYLPETQLNIFQNDTNEPSTKILQQYKIVPNKNVSLPTVHKIQFSKVRISKYPTAYIAAPYTSLSEPTKSVDDNLLIPKNDLAIIPDGEFKLFLLDIERSLKNYGISAIIPHRDVNRWGLKELTPRQVFSLCSEYVIESDIFVGVLGLSHGSHYEFGLAHGMGKPCILFKCDQLPKSFISDGIITNHADILVINIKKFSDLEEALGSQEVLKYLEKYIPIKRKKLL